MSPALAAVKRSMQACLHEHEFQRKGTTWYRDLPETILVVNLQGSRYGGESFINLAVWLKALGTNNMPKENVCHIRKRLAGKRLEAALELKDSELSDVEREQAIRSALERTGIPFLLACSSHPGLRKMLSQAKLRDAVVDKAVESVIRR